MPKRMLDDSYLNSPSLDRCSPRAQDSFPRFILLADDFGCFEADPRRLLALGWSSKRSDVTDRDVWGWLEEYVGVGMAVLWEVNERRYCFLTGWNGPHGQRVRAEYSPTAPKGTPAYHGSKRRTPVPPADLVEAVKAGLRLDRDGRAPGTGDFPGGNRAGAAEIPGGKPNQTIPNDSVPAREMRGNSAGNAREIRGSAAAVPVAVPVAVAVAGAREAARAPLRDVLREEWEKEYPQTTSLLTALAVAGVHLSKPRQATVTGGIEASVGTLGVEKAAEAVQAAHADDPNPSLGWYAKALYKAAHGGGKPTHAATAPAADHAAFQGGRRVL